MTRAIHVLALTAVLFAALGAAPGTAFAAPPTTPGTYAQAILSGGVVRHYILHIPAGYTGATRRPVVFVLHGFGGSAAGMMSSTGMNAKSDAEEFFVAYLQGMPCDPNPPYGHPACNSGQAGWNSGLTPELGIVTDDVLFVRDVLIRLEESLRVDVRRVYATGFSNGAFMTHRLGAELPDVLAAIAPVAGTVGVRDSGGTLLTIPAPIGSIPVMMVHGVLDPNVRYYGGVGAGAGTLDVLPVQDAVDFWRAANSCSAGPVTQTSPNGNIVVDFYGGCFLMSHVKLVSIGNGLHVWPTQNPWGTGFPATDAIWNFFENHLLT
jgi:polyhydroxybutyrate depolymerase